MIKKILLSSAIIASPLAASAATLKCTVNEAGDMDKVRVYVRCNEAVVDGTSNVNIFALPYGTTVDEKAKTARFFALTQTALATGAPLLLTFTTGTAGTNSSIYCTDYCRIADGFKLTAK